MKRRLLAACLLGLAGCAGNDAAPVASSSLPPGVVAKVGPDPIAEASVARLFRSRGLTADAAATLAISDALWAQAARARLSLGSSRAIERAALARAVLEQLSQAAEAAGPPSDAELATIVEHRWVELARPDAAKTSHVVVLNDAPERDAAARKLADELFAALRDAKSSDELLRIGRAFPSGGFEIRAESLAFVTSDGRTFERRGDRFVALPTTFDPSFARAALALDHPGQLSPVVKSEFGYHVIRLDERLPGSAVPASDLRGLLAPETWAERAAKARRQLIDDLRRGAAVQVERAADDLTARVDIRP